MQTNAQASSRTRGLRQGPGAIPLRAGSLPLRLPATALVLSLSASLASCYLSSAEEKGEETVQVPANTKLVVTNRNGAVRVERGVAGRIRIRWVKRASAIAAAEGLLSEIHVTRKLEGGVLKVAAAHPSSAFSRNYGVRFTISVPESTPVEIRDSNGSITVQDVGAPARLETSNGRIRVTGARGLVAAETHNGDIEVSGRLTGFRLKTSNGTIHVRLEPGSEIREDSSARTSNGRIRLEAPKDLAFTYEAKTSNGTVETDFPVARRDEHSAHGSSGPGGHLVRLRTSNGDIQLRAL